MLWEHPVHGQMAKNGALSENHVLSQAARAEGGWMKGPVTTVVRAGARGTLSSHMLHRCLGSQGAARPEQLAESPQVLGTPLSDAEPGPDSGCARHRATWLSIDSCENTVDALHTMRSSPWPLGSCSPWTMWGNMGGDSPLCCDARHCSWDLPAVVEPSEPIPPTHVSCVGFGPPLPQTLRHSPGATP